MVLSNKKLKQKLRAAAFETFIGTEGNDQLNQDSNSELKELLDTAKRKPRLSKREKRRKDVSLKGLDSIQQRSNGVVSEGESKNKRKGDNDKENGGVGLIDGEENSKKKKRKRDELRGNGDVGSEEKEGVVKEGSMETSKKKNKKKKKKKKTKKQEKKGKEEGEKLEGAEEGTTEANNSNGR